MIKMSSKKSKKLKRLHVGGLPLIHAVAERMKLREILYEYIGTHGNEEIPAVESLMLLIFNLTRGKAPLYELEQWVSSLDGRCLGYEEFPLGKFNDDRFGRALDKLYRADRATLMTRLVVSTVKEFGLSLDRIHNDSTSVKAFGRMAGKTRTGFELKRGKSKDHRPDLKQLVFSLSISSDGAVPVHCKAYPGNRTDDTTHIETWDTIRTIHGNPSFLYVADSKLCTDEQLRYIVGQEGRAVTIIPETWSEPASFKESLRKAKKPKKEIWRRRKPGSDEESEYFSLFAGNYVTRKRGYKIHWIYSSEKRKRDRTSREHRLRKTEWHLMELNAKINKRNLKTKEAVEAAAKKVLEDRQAERFFHLDVGTTRQEHRIQVGKGRPGKNTKYSRRIQTICTLTWTRNTKSLQEEANTDGAFPLLCTDETLSSKEVLQAYKFQPRLEKRFSQFKTTHSAAPLLFKKIDRIEANMFAFFIALMIQALVERELRQKMEEYKIPSLTLYPEDRNASHPTTSKVMNIFADLSTYKLTHASGLVEEFKDDLTKTHKTILRLLNMSQNDFWGPR
jgi:transposase